MIRTTALLTFAFVLALPAHADAPKLGKDARIGVIDAFPPRLSAAIGRATTRDPAPTIKNEWKFGEVANREAVARLREAGWRADPVTPPAALADAVRNGGALQMRGYVVVLSLDFRKQLEVFMKAQGLDAVLLLRVLPRPLAPSAPSQAGFGIARLGTQSVAFANLAPVLISGAPPAITAAEQCLITRPVDAALVEHPTSRSDLKPLAPPIEEALQQGVDGALVRAGVIKGDAQCVK